MKSQLRSGFTIVEIIIVVVIIGILSGLTYVGVTNYSKKSAENGLKTELASLAKDMKTSQTEQNTFPSTLPTKYSSSSKYTFTLRSNSATAYCVDAVPVGQPNVKYYVNQLNTNPQVGDCAGESGSLATPTMTGSINGGTLAVNVNAVSGATGYDYQWRAAGSNGAWTYDSPNYSTTFRQFAHTNGVEAQVRARSASGTSAWSASVQKFALSQPANPDICRVSGGSGTPYGVSWDALPNGTHSDYEIYDGENEDLLVTVENQRSTPGRMDELIDQNGVTTSYYVVGVTPDGDRTNRSLTVSQLSSMDDCY